jgi:transcriptional regulator with XRE-family HTH domain
VPNSARPTLGEEIDQARRQAGYSLRDLAGRTGIALSRINRIVTNEVERPSPETIKRLAGVLGLSLARLFTLAGYPYPDLDDLLRTNYRLPQSAIAKIHEIIEGHTQEDEF